MSRVQRHVTGRERAERSATHTPLPLAGRIYRRRTKCNPPGPASPGGPAAISGSVPAGSGAGPPLRVVPSHGPGPSSSAKGPEAAPSLCPPLRCPAGPPSSSSLSARLRSRLGAGGPPRPTRPHATPTNPPVRQRIGPGTPGLARHCSLPQGGREGGGGGRRQANPKKEGGWWGGVLLRLRRTPSRSVTLDAVS